MDTGSAGRTVRHPRVSEAAVALVLVAGFSTILVGLHVRAYTTVSPIDELQHFDYAEKVSRGVLPRPGDRIGEAAMREESCRRIDANFFPPPCDAPTVRPQQYQEDGYATSAGQMPVYYAVTGWAGRLLTRLVGAGSLLTGMRLAGALWLTGGLATLWWALRSVGLDRLVSASLVAIVGCTPVVLQATAVLNPDAQLLLGGSALVLALLAVPRRAGLIGLGVVAAVGVFVEETMLLGVGAVVAYCFVRTVQLRGLGATAVRAAAVHLAAASVALAGAAVGVATVLVVGHLIGGTDPGFAVPKNRLLHVEQVPWGRIAEQVVAMVTPVRAPAAAPALRSGLPVAIRSVVDWALLGGLVGSVIGARAGSRRAALAGSTLTAMVLGGPALAAVSSAVGHQFYEIPARYGLPLLPGAAVVLGQSVGKPSARVLLAVVAGVASAVTIGALALG